MNQDKIPSYIAVEGPIGVGKTSLARKISADFGHQLCLEQPDENPFLKDFYENRQKFAFATQIHFVMQRSHQLNKYFFFHGYNWRKRVGKNNAVKSY